MTNDAAGADQRVLPRRMLAIAGVAAAVAFAYVLRGVLVPLFIAFLVAYALDPIVDRLERLRVPRAAAAPLVMVGLLAVVVLVSFFAVPFFIDELAAASRSLPQQITSLHARLDAFMLERFHYQLPATWGELMEKYGAVLTSHVPAASSLVGALFGTVNAIFVVLGSLIIPVFSLYLLVDFDRIVERAGSLVPRRWAKAVDAVALDVHVTLGRYVRGQILANLVLAALYAVGLRLVGVRLGIPIGLLTGALAFVPYVGLALGTLLAVLMALLDWHGASHVVGVLVVMGTVGLLDGMVITPRIVGGSVGLKPIEVLLTMMAAATLFGFLGVLLAVPLGAVMKILIGRAVKAYLASRFYAQPPAAPDAPPAGAAVPEALGEAAADGAR